MSDTRTPSPFLQKQSTRRIVYGLNVAVAALVALAIVVLINWIAYRQYVRFDLTATREYSLSEQTYRVLDRLEAPYRVVTLFDAVSPQLAYIEDLTDEYGRYAPSLEVVHVSPGLEPEARDALYRELVAGHREELAPVAAAADEGRAALEEAVAELAALVEPLQQSAADPGLPPGKVKEFLESGPAAIEQTRSQVRDLLEGVRTALDHPLPDYPAVRTSLEQTLNEMSTNVLARLATRFDQAASEPSVPAAVKDRLLGMRTTANRIRERVDAALAALKRAPQAAAYNELIGSLVDARGERDVVVVTGPRGVRVVNVEEMYRPSEAGEGPGFIGEERLTGALVSLSVEKPAMVVFVTAPALRATGEGGQFTQVAERLRAANFDVRQWNPAGQMTSMGQQMAPDPPPAPEPGQQTIWVVLPQLSNNPVTAGAGKPQIASTLGAMREGDAALVMLAPEPGATLGETDPIVDYLRGWGINPQLERVVLREVQVSDHRTQTTANFPVSRWPEGLPITRALGSMQGLFAQASPIAYGGAEGVEHAPLVRLTGERVWAEDDFASVRSLSQAPYDPEDGAEAFTIGVAAERAGQRLIAVADPVWAADAVTTLGYNALLGTRGPGVASQPGGVAQFPANSELFVNSVYWLAGLDELIAASPRTRDTRRVEPMSEGALRAYRVALLAGLPLAIAATGLGVYLVRRRG